MENENEIPDLAQPKLSIQAPDDDTDRFQDEVLLACMEKRQELTAVLEKHGALSASISTFASGDNEDRLPLVQCTITFPEPRDMDIALMMTREMRFVLDGHKIQTRTPIISHQIETEPERRII